MRSFSWSVIILAVPLEISEETTFFFSIIMEVSWSIFEMTVANSLFARLISSNILKAFWGSVKNVEYVRVWLFVIRYSSNFEVTSLLDFFSIIVYDSLCFLTAFLSFQVYLKLAWYLKHVSEFEIGTLSFKSSAKLLVPLCLSPCRFRVYLEAVLILLYFWVSFLFEFYLYLSLPLKQEHTTQILS